MTVSTRRVWCAAPRTLTAGWAGPLVTATVVAALACLSDRRRADLGDAHDTLSANPEANLCIRRARPDDAPLLTQLERAASEAELRHVFGSHPYPVADVIQRWRQLLNDRLTSVRLLELDGEPVGFVAFDDQTVRHLGVVPEHTRRGYGSRLLGHAMAEIFSGGAPAARLWVLTQNTTARRFYATLGWQDTAGRRVCEFPPFPEELELSWPNPTAIWRATTQQRSA